MAAIACSLMVTIPVCAPTAAQSQVFGRRLSSKAAVQRPILRASFAVRAAGPKVGEDIAEKIAEAKEVCDSGSTGECAAAWDEVEEISAEAAHAKLRAKESGSDDPLEAFCADNPETDECRTYED